jgi:hypothetical protein
MNKIALQTAPVVLSSICAAHAADNASRIQESPARDSNRIGISYRVGYNIDATFSGIGRSAAASNPGPMTGGVNHEYDDGYVRVDSTNNGLDLTWNWGFESPSQVSGDNLFMHSTRSLGGSSRSGGDDLHHGMEATYSRELGTYKKARWGVEGAFNYLNVAIRDNGSVGADLEVTTDTYDLEGIDPFDPPGSQNPYQGTFTGPGPLIADAPINRTVQVTPGVVTGRRELDANLFGFRVGPYIEWPIADKWTVGLNAGFALVVVDSEFDFRETVSPSSGTPFTVSGSGSETDLLPGGYIGANVAYRIADSVTLFSSAQFQYAGEFKQEVQGKHAELDLGKSLFVTLGVNYSF